MLSQRTHRAKREFRLKVKSLDLPWPRRCHVLCVLLWEVDGVTALAVFEPYAYYH